MHLQSSLAFNERKIEQKHATTRVTETDLLNVIVEVGR
jgi:hypothetical protein